MSRDWVRFGRQLLISVALIAVATAHLYLRSFAADQLYNEKYRPQFHFSPARNWTNDPNGPIYYQGEYHLFYQYNPFGDVWGHMSWGHAVSTDLVHWQDLPVALAEENGIMIFSGSTVVDWNNTSGFCTSTNPANRSCLVAIYTGHSEKLQTQNLAYSNDKGRTWTKYPQNPVLDLHMSSFRDPKVFWYEATRKWIMVTVLASQHKVRFFSSDDLKHWSALSDFGPAGATGGAWECPDLFPLPVVNQPGQSRWVLSINLNPGGIAGGSGNQYFVGQFDGKAFTADSESQTLWADYGADFYASTSFSDLPAADHRKIWIGWLNNWDYARQVPTSPWRGSQSIPRELKLERFTDGLRLEQEPIVELHALRDTHTHLEKKNIEAANGCLKPQTGETFEIAIEFELGAATEVGLKVRKGTKEETLVGVQAEPLRMFVDRTRSGDGSFHKSFPARHAGPIHLEGGKRAMLHIFLDRSSLEVFGNHGETVISDTIFPSDASNQMELYAVGGTPKVFVLDIWKLKSIH